MTQRRFIHRSLREHLVAEHVAMRMPAKDAADELLKHLWYDLDWEYTAPGALTTHPRREQVLKKLIRLVTGEDQPPIDLAAVDGCWEIRRFLARVAQESCEVDWSPKSRKLIEKARLDLASSWSANLPLLVASKWPTSNRLIIESLLDLLAAETGSWEAAQLAHAAAHLAVTQEDRARVRQAIPARFADGTVPKWPGTLHARSPGSRLERSIHSP